MTVKSESAEYCVHVHVTLYWRAPETSIALPLLSCHTVDIAVLPMLARRGLQSTAAVCGRVR